MRFFSAEYFVLLAAKLYVKLTLEDL